MMIIQTKFLFLGKYSVKAAINQLKSATLSVVPFFQISRNKVKLIEKSNIIYILITSMDTSGDFRIINNKKLRKLFTGTKYGESMPINFKRSRSDLI